MDNVPRHDRPWGWARGGVGFRLYISFLQVPTSGLDRDIFMTDFSCWERGRFLFKEISFHDLVEKGLLLHFVGYFDSICWRLN